MKRALTGILSASLALGTFIPAAFADVTATDVNGADNQSAIQEMMNLGIINPYTNDNTFRPTDKVTRGQFVSYIYTILSKEGLIQNYRPAKAMFKDVGNGIFCYNQVNTMAHAGFVKGLGNGSFGQGWTVPATFAAEVMLNVLKANNVDGTDYNADDTYAALNVARNLGLFDGTPQADDLSSYYMNRSQTAQVLENLYVALKPDKFAGVATSLQATAQYDTASVGDTDAITVAGQDPNGNAVDSVSGVKFRIVSDNASDATVDDQGNFKATKAGNYTVEAYVDNGLVSNDVAITVADKLAVKSVAATAADTFTVTFNNPVDDTTKATFDVKEGTFAVQTAAVTWSADKTTATIKKSFGTFAADTYTVDVNGLGLDTTAYTATVAAQKIAKVTFGGQALIKAADSKSGTFTYHVFDQYGTDITSTASLQASTSYGTVSLNPATGVGTVNYDFSNPATAPTAVVVTLVDPTTGTNASQSLTVAAAASISKFTFGDVKLASGVSRLTTKAANAGEIAFTAVDQYGNNITDASQLNNSLKLVSSDPNVSFTFATDGTDGKTYIVVNTTNLSAAENVTVTAVNSVTGLAVSDTLQIAAPAAPAALTFGQLSTPVVAQGDTTYLPINVTDQFGNTLTADQVVAAGQTALKLAATGGLSDLVNAVKLVTDKNSSHYGQLALAPTATGYATLISTLSTTPVTLNINVQATRHVATVTAPSSQYLMEGATGSLAFTFADQYTAAYTPGTNTTADAAYHYAVTVTPATGSTPFAPVTTANGKTDNAGGVTGTNVADLTSIKAAAGTATGSETVTVKIYDGNNNVVSQASTSVNVTTNNVTGLTYSLGTVPTLAGDAKHTAASSDNYSKALSFSAKDASGNSYAINPADIVSVVSSNTAVAAVAQDPTTKTWYVAGQNVTGISTSANQTATLTATINTLSGVQTVTTTVTVSPAAPSVSAIRVVDGALAGATTDASGVNDKGYFAYGVNAYAFNVIGEDQYGVWNNVAPGAGVSVVVNSTNLLPANAFVFDGSTLKLANGVTAPAAGSSVLVTVLVNGQAKQVTVTF